MQVTGWTRWPWLPSPPATRLMWPSEPGWAAASSAPCWRPWARLIFSGGGGRRRPSPRGRPATSRPSSRITTCPWDPWTGKNPPVSSSTLLSKSPTPITTRRPPSSATVTWDRHHVTIIIIINNNNNNNNSSSSSSSSSSRCAPTSKPIIYSKYQPIR